MSELITVQGTARSGKGTLSSGLVERLSQNGLQVTAIDVGLKYRVIAHEYQATGGDFADPVAIDEYITRTDFRENMLGVFEKVQTMTSREREETYHSAEVSARVARIGERAVAQETVGDLRDEEIRRAVQHNDVTIVDGRALYDHGVRIEQELNGEVRYLLASEVICSPMVAATRVLRKRFQHEPDMSEIVAEACTIAARNLADSAPGRVEQMRPIQSAYWLDLGRSDPDIASDVRTFRSLGARAIWVDNSITQSRDQLVAPVADFIDALLA